MLWLPSPDAGLVISGESFVIEMSRLMKIGSGEEVAYGYRLIAEAQLAPSTVKSMHLACNASEYVCASILSECGGDEEEALRRYGNAEVRQKWEELESLSEQRKQSLGLRSGGCFVASEASAAEDRTGTRQHEALLLVLDLWHLVLLVLSKSSLFPGLLAAGGKDRFGCSHTELRSERDSEAYAQ